jgi:4-hydroxy-tetrahydrodipicolinate synthase
MFTGCGTALVTPFSGDLSLDEPTLRKLVHRQLEAGIDFLVPCGTTGESPTLTRAEHLRVVEICLEESHGKTPVLAGAGGYNTTEVIALAQELEHMGVQGILSVTPYYNKPTAEGVYQHYKAIAAATRLPLVVYNVPGRTNVNVAPDTLVRLAEIDNIVGVKEASGSMSQIVAILNRVPDGFTVLSGDDALALPMMALGGRGVISVASNVIPGQMGRLAELGLAGDFAAALALHRELHPLMEINFIETNPIPVKASMGLMGLLEPVFRLPLVPPTPESLEKIHTLLKSRGMIEGTYAAVRN